MSGARGQGGLDELGTGRKVLTDALAMQGQRKVMSRKVMSRKVKSRKLGLFKVCQAKHFLQLYVRPRRVS